MVVWYTSISGRFPHHDNGKGIQSESIPEAEMPGLPVRNEERQAASCLLQEAPPQTETRLTINYEKQLSIITIIIVVCNS